MVTLSRKEPLQGWALKTQRKGQRATQNVKNFLLEKFNSGVETGNSTNKFFCFTLAVWLTAFKRKENQVCREQVERKPNSLYISAQ